MGASGATDDCEGEAAGDGAGSSTGSAGSLAGAAGAAGGEAVATSAGAVAVVVGVSVPTAGVIPARRPRVTSEESANVFEAREAIKGNLQIVQAPAGAGRFPGKGTCVLLM